ncbi:MAG: DNA methyltransferase [Alphaproteobacteria bacterium]|nr:MAG: DNA methyltransferase [Alphaproteobacteria bacterium]
MIVPFLKWAGGKRWLVSAHPELLPSSYKNYLEPFLGSGAVYFHMRPKVAILGDANAELIETYQQIKNNWSSVEEILNSYHQQHTKDFYYEIRTSVFDTAVERAAKFIYLNRTCWNGLYRVNLSGNFNVPIGTKKHVLLSTDDFKSVSKQLNNTELHATDFQTIIENAQKNDFLFVDPPYTVKHNLNGFVKYNNKLFSWDDQIRLRDAIDNAVSRGVKVLLTNADHESIHDLYQNIGEKMSLNRSSVISGKASARGKYSELIIKCYKT